MESSRGNIAKDRLALFLAKKRDIANGEVTPERLYLQFQDICNLPPDVTYENISEDEMKDLGETVRKKLFRGAGVSEPGPRAAIVMLDEYIEMLPESEEKKVFEYIINSFIWDMSRQQAVTGELPKNINETRKGLEKSSVPLDAIGSIKERIIPSVEEQATEYKQGMVWAGDLIMSQVEDRENTEAYIEQIRIFRQEGKLSDEVIWGLAGYPPIYTDVDTYGRLAEALNEYIASRTTKKRKDI